MTSNAVDHSVVGDWRLPDDEFLEVFTLPGPMDRCTALELLNPLGPREARINFEEATHTYYIDGTTVAPRSVTGPISWGGVLCFQIIDARQVWCIVTPLRTSIRRRSSS